MADASSDTKDETNSKTKRNVPSWMNSKEDGNKSRRRKQEDACQEGKSSKTTQNDLSFSKLLEGVVFVLSGFVNPERSTLRSQALDMGAEYRADWTSDCTLLVCAFPNTPKFKQVESDCGTVVSKEWITECYNQKKLVDIERFLMHSGKPWRKSKKQLEINEGQKNAPVEEPKRRTKRTSHEKLTRSGGSEGGLSNTIKDHFSPSKLKEWALDDLRKTVSWLESQEEKPEANQINTIAAEGILTCLQDAIEALKQNKDIRLVTEQWNFVPRVVKELEELEDGRSKKVSLSKEVLSEVAITCKKVYGKVYDELDSSMKNKKHKTDGNEAGNMEMQISPDDAGFDSDSTIEMTEEEIELACRRLNSEYCE